MSQFRSRKQSSGWAGDVIEDIRSIVWAIGQVLLKSKSPAIQKGHKRLVASSLAFKTVLALVPALAIVMAVLANDTLSQKREQMLDQIVDVIYPVQTQSDSSFFDPNEPSNLQQLNKVSKQEIRISMKKFATYSRRAGLMGFFGFVVVVFLLMRDIETSFNFLWGIEKSRKIWLQMIRHTVFFIGLPVLAIILLTLKGWFSSWDLLLPIVHSWVFTSFLPFLTVAAACAWMYLLIPNTKVETHSAVLTGLFVCFLLEIARWLMNWYTWKLFAGAHLYGAVWMFPVILLWFYVSWTVILFGAELAYFIQKHRTRYAT